MKIGVIFLLLWFLLVALALVAAVAAALLRGVGTLKWSVLLIIGAILLYGFVSAGIGMAEGVWTFTTPGFLVAAGVGTTGMVSMIVAVAGLVRCNR